jgi:mono/diheme cytochrome c family protein
MPSPNTSLSRLLSAAAIGLATALPVAADDAVDAHQLYQDNCLQCHGSEVYTRADRKITSLPALKSQVRMCEQNLGLTWFDEQIDGVASLLNKEFYKFGE